MEHLKDIDIIEFAAGNLSLDDAHKLECHTAVCPQCRDKVVEFQSHWGALGGWAESAIQKDMTADIHSRIGRHYRRPSGVVGILLHRFAFRSAAIILIGALVGFMAGKYNDSRHLDSLQAAAVPEYMQSLSLSFSTELAWAAMETGFEQRGDQ